MTSTDDYLGKSLMASLSNVREALASEIHEIGVQLSDRLAVHFALGIAQSCGDLHSENMRLREQLGIFHGNALDDEPMMVGREMHGVWTSHPKVIAEALLERSNSPGPDEHARGVEQADSEIAPASPKCLKQVRCPAVPEDVALVSKNHCTKGSENFQVQSSMGSPATRPAMFYSSTLEWLGNPSCVMILVTSRPFEGFFNMMIVLNCCMMGFEAEQIARGPSSELSELVLIVAEQVFCVAFTVELGLRIYAFGWREFVPCKYRNTKEGPWNVMDMCLVVVTGVLFTWVVPLVSLIFESNSERDGIISTLSVLRSLRLFRIVHVIKTVPALREAWLLLQGLTDSVRTLVWTVFVIMTVTYIWAIFGTVLIARVLYERRAQIVDNPERYADLTTLIDYCGGLTSIMYTLIQMLTMDSWNGIVRELKREIGWCWLYFYSYVALAVFVIMNLVTAIIVENAIAHSKRDEDHAIKNREKEKKAEINKLQDLFVAMDEDGNGTLSWDEFCDSFQRPETLRMWKFLEFEPEECKELFKLLGDGDGEIETEEFFEGLGKMKGYAQSKDIFRLQMSIEQLARGIETTRTQASTSRRVQANSWRKTSDCNSVAQSGVQLSAPSGGSSPAGSVSELGSPQALNECMPSTGALPKMDQCREGPHYSQLVNAVKKYLDGLARKDTGEPRVAGPGNAAKRSKVFRLD